MTQMDLNICADQDYRAADAELNKTYRLAVAAMQATDKELGDIDAAYAGALEALKKPSGPGSAIATANANSPGSRRGAARWNPCWSPVASQS